MAWVISNVLYSPERLSKQPLRSRCPADIHILRGKKKTHPRKDVANGTTGCKRWTEVDSTCK